MSGGKPGGGGLSQTSGTGSTHTGEGSFWDFNPRNIAGINDFLTAAGQRAQGISSAGSGYRNSAQDLLQTLSSGGSGRTQTGLDVLGRFSGGALPEQFARAEGISQEMRDIASRKVTGENIKNDPAFLEAQRVFENMTGRKINNAAALMGLGNSSTLLNAQAQGKIAHTLPMVQEALAREERGITREMGAAGEQARNLMTAGGTALGANQAYGQATLGAGAQENALMQNAAQMFAGLGEQERTALMNEMQALGGLGTQFRGIEQEQLDAPYQEQQRLWAEALNSMYGPLGMIGSLIGGTSTSSQSKK
jgi:hypothetical protein